MKKYISIIILLIFSWANLNALDSAAKKHLLDSLNCIYKISPDSDKFVIIDEICQKLYGESEEINYHFAAYDLAKKNYNLEREAISLKNICIYYYNKLDNERFVKYAKKLEEMPLNELTVKSYFKIQQLWCLIEIWDGNAEFAIERATQMQKKALLLNDPYGEIYCQTVLGDIYSELQQHEKAITAYKYAESLLERNNGTSREIGHLVTCMIDLYLNDNKISEAFVYNEKFLKLIEKEKAKSRTDYPIERGYRLYYSANLSIQCRKGDEEKALLAYENLINTKSIPDWYVEMRSNIALAEYFLFCSDYASAEKYANQAHDSSTLYSPEISNLMTNIYEKKGDYKNADIFLFNDFNSLQSNYIGKILSEFNQFEYTCEVQTTEREAHEEAFRSEQKKRIIIISGLVVIVILLVIIILAYLYTLRLSRKLSSQKDLLTHEKNILLENQKRLEMAYEKAEENNKIKSSFLNNMSHEIRTPLNSIMGFSDIITSSVKDDPTLKSYVEIVSANSSKLLSLINNILELGRFDAGMMQLNIQECHLTHIVGDLIDKNKHLINKPLIIGLKSEPQDIIINTDLNRLSQLIDNLINNAFKFTPENQEVDIQITSNEEDVKFIITNYGITIPTDSQEIIFERFEKLDNFTQGTGLGLSLGLALSTRLSGTLELDTTFKDGVRFILVLPHHISE